MLDQIQIHADPNLSNQEKGDFFEGLLRLVMERQRYDVASKIRFTGLEIDLLCRHKDRAAETALIECKARANIVSEDIKSFSFNILVDKKAKNGFFVHTSEMRGEAAGMVLKLNQEHPDQLNFWGPSKVIELLQDCGAIAPYVQSRRAGVLNPTKRILLYTYQGRFWVTVYNNGIVPTHYSVSSASVVDSAVDPKVMEWIATFDELRNLSRIDDKSIPVVKSGNTSFDAVAEIQEAEQWDDYRPVGAKFFVGRNDIREKLYQFVQTPTVGASMRRVFFVEGKSGWGKSSILAQLRARSRNRRNRHLFFVLAVDSRSANTPDFVSLSVAKLVTKATENNVVPARYSTINITSASDVLASAEMQSLLSWLKSNKRVLVIIFDQFEDIFRKEDLFRTFHKLMMDVSNQQGFLIIGFSWKSEINIPIDNPAYSLWQQARNLAETFRLEEFLGSEVDQVIRQLEQVSKQQLPVDLKRKLKEGSQGFPWLTKKLSIHCYRQMLKGVNPEELVDQNLNVDMLFNQDMETLSSDEARALRMIAQRGYEGNSFDVAEVDDRIQEPEISSLLSKRLIVRSGGKYNVYWDVFRDYLIEGKVPTLGESFLLREYPATCEETLQFIIDNTPCTIEDIMSGVKLRSLKEGTVLNRVRELRYLGAVKKVEGLYRPRPTIRNIDDFKTYVNERLTANVVVRTISRLTGDSITERDVINILQHKFKGYGFAEKTWATYAGYLIGWLTYANIDFGHRLARTAGQRRTVTGQAFTPQWRPAKDIGLFLSFKGCETVPMLRQHTAEKGLYDLKALGLLTYEGRYIYLTKRGMTLLKEDDLCIRRHVAEFAVNIPKIAVAFNALLDSRKPKATKFVDLLAPALVSISSPTYRKLVTNVLRSWAMFLSNELRGQKLAL